MSKIYRGSVRVVLLVVLSAAVLGGGVVFIILKYRGSAGPVPPAPQPAPPTTVTTAPSTKPVVAANSDAAYIGVIRAAYPEFPATQPLGMPLDLSHAAHLVLGDPVYLEDSRKEMWITRADAPPIEEVLKDAVDPEKDLDVHLVREHVSFVHWMPTRDPVWPPYLVSRANDGNYEVVSARYGRQRLPLHDGYHWEHAFSWNDKVVVATAHGVCVFRFGSDVMEEYHELASASAASRPADAFSEPRVLFGGDGLLAWLPWEGGKIGGRGLAQYVDAVNAAPTKRVPGRWTDLTPETGWPEKLLHIVPLVDGTVLLLIVNERGAVQVQFNSLEHTTVKEEVILKLIDNLAEGDKDVRDKAQDELSQYGPGIWPILEKQLKEDPFPEAALRMKKLLKQKATPTLNGMVLLGNKGLKLVSRLGDGGTVFFAEAGVSIPDPDNLDDVERVVPAWISIRPGEAIKRLPERLATDLTAGQSKLYVNGSDWLVTNDLAGPRRFVGNSFVTMLRKKEHIFTEFVGSDRRGRWLFREPVEAGRTLIIDPTLPDPTPRLPVWEVTASQTGVETVGWTKDGWAVEKKNGMYSLREFGWQALDDKEPVFTEPREVPPPVEPGPPTTPATNPTTRPAVPATLPATLPSTVLVTLATTKPDTMPAPFESSEPPILTDRDGSRYFGGLTDLTVITRAGKQIRWTLPAIANGQQPVWLLRTSNDRLYLFNQPGRVLRIKPTPDGAEPFAVEKIFSHRVPTVARPTRIWLDPAGRIVMAWENKLAVMFPSGYIPKQIGDLMMADIGSDSDDE